MDNQSKNENDIIELLRSARKAETPSRELFAQILARLDAAPRYVTEIENSRYDKKKGREDVIHYNLLDQIQDLMISKKLLLPIGGMAVALLLLVVLGGSKKEAPLTPGATPLTNEESSAPKVIKEVVVPQTSNVTALANTLLDLAEADEQSVISDASADAGFVNLETTAISDFGQSVNGSF